MSKAGIAAATVLGGGGLAAGGIYLSKTFSVDSELPSKLEEFEKTDGGGCVQSIFSGIKEVKKDSPEDVSSSDEKIGNGAGTNNEQVSGCLVVNWDKWTGQEESTKDKWRGNFRFLWAFAKGNKGFVVYVSANTPNPPPNTGQKLKVEGVRYVLEKKEKGWEIIKGKKVDTNKDLEASKLPKPGDKLPQVEKDSQWNFAKEDENLSKLCGENECKHSSPDKSFRGYWIWNSADSKTKDSEETADKWSSNITEWWTAIFENTNWNMQTVLSNIKGTWKNKVIY